MNEVTREEWPARLRRAEAHLSAADPILRAVIDQVGPSEWVPDRKPFVALVSSIISQQISVKAARSIRGRVELLLGGEPSPEAILRVGDAALRSAGLSNAKVRYVRHLAERVATGDLDLATIHQRPDEEAIADLTKTHGIGRWTAEMYLIFSAGRLDVLPVDDLGLRAGIRRLYGLEALPGAAEIQALAVPWQPFRSLATWYIWRGGAVVPATATTNGAAAETDPSG